MTSALIFVILRVLPGDPTAIRASRPGVTEAQLEHVREQLGLDRPLLTQYLDWLGGVVRGDFGESYFSAYTTTALIRASLGPTFQLAFAAMLLGLIMALGLAVGSTIWRGSILDRLAQAFMALGMAVPAFVIGISSILLFGSYLGWLPTRGYVSPTVSLTEHLRYLALPAITMGIAVAAPILRMLRASLTEVMHSDYVRTAQAVGMSWHTVVIRHGVRNAFVPTLSLIGLSIGQLMGGVVVVEYVFGWPGLGTLAIQSVFNRDYAVLQGIVLFAAIAFVITSLAVDLTSRALDPRLKESRL